MKTTLLMTALAATLGASPYAQAQIAGTSTTVGAQVAAQTQMAVGWSAKKAILGKTVVNESGATVGKVEDLIIAPDKNVSYLIVGAGGFVGIGRHDVAVPVSQIENREGKLVMAGATKELVKAMPKFEYTDQKADRSAFLARADQDIAKAKNDIDALERRASAASGDAKAAMDKQSTALKADLKAAEVQLSEMKSAAADRWKEFEAKVTAANLRMRKSIDKAMG